VRLAGNCGRLYRPARFYPPPDFPDAIVHSEMRARNGHVDYAAAKAGDAEAASSLVDDLLLSPATDEIVRLVADRPAIVLPVIAEETTGFMRFPTPWYRPSATLTGERRSSHRFRRWPPIKVRGVLPRLPISLRRVH
jgi:hypothetical protein